MVTEFDVKLVPKAQQMLNKFGAAAVYAKVNGGTYDIEDGVVGGTTTNHNVKIVPPFPIREDLKFGDTYKEGDLTTYLADQDLIFEPGPGPDRVTLGSQVFAVVGARPIRSGDLVAVWELILRKN